MRLSGLVLFAATAAALPVAAAPAWNAARAIEAAKQACPLMAIHQWNAAELSDRWEVTGINLNSLTALSVTILKNREKPNGCSVRRGLVQQGK